MADGMSYWRLTRCLPIAQLHIFGDFQRVVWCDMAVSTSRRKRE